MKSKGERRGERKRNGESLTPRNPISGSACAWLADDMRSDGGLSALFIGHRTADVPSLLRFILQSLHTINVAKLTLYLLPRSSWNRFAARNNPLDCRLLLASLLRSSDGRWKEGEEMAETDGRRRNSTSDLID